MMELFSSQFSHINEVIKKNLDDREPEFIQILDFLELLGDFEQTEINNILNYLEFNNFIESIAIYSKDKLYQKVTNPFEILSRLFKEIRANNLTYSKVMGFNFDFRQSYTRYYFCLFDLFQINALKQINFKEKYACDKAIGANYAYISNCTIGSIFSPNDLVIGFSKTRLNELLESEHIEKIDIEPINLNKYEQLSEKQKIVHRYIDNFMGSQVTAFTDNNNELKVNDFFNVDVISSDKSLSKPTQADNSELVQFFRAENERLKGEINELKSKLKKEHDTRIDNNIENTRELMEMSRLHWAECNTKDEQIAELKAKLEQAGEPSQSDTVADDENNNIGKSALCLIAMLKDLLLDPNGTPFRFKSDNENSNGKPSQTGLQNYIAEMQIKNLSDDAMKKLFAKANNELKDAKKE